MRVVSISMWVGAVVSLFMGFNKMYVYENSDLSFVTNKNAHVGGDAYNMIINGTHSTAYFVLFGALLLAGIMMEILKAVKDNNKAV